MAVTTREGQGAGVDLKESSFNWVEKQVNLITVRLISSKNTRF